jgi:hypothetical protein
MKSYLFYANQEEIGDLAAWAEDPEHCSNNEQVGKWLRHILQADSVDGAAWPVPPEIAAGLEELCNDWRDFLDGGGEGPYFFISASVDMKDIQ